MKLTLLSVTYVTFEIKLLKNNIFTEMTDIFVIDWLLVLFRLLTSIYACRLSTLYEVYTSKKAKNAYCRIKT